MYYVQKKAPQSPQKLWKNNSSSNNDEVGAHSFCSRCGVQILHAPNSHSTALDVNIECLYKGEAKFQLMLSQEKVAKKVDLSAGTFVIGQWDGAEQDNGFNSYPATIAEEMMPERSPFGAYKQHPLLRPQSDFETLDDYYDDDTADVMLASIPGTPSTVQTSQTGSLVSSYRTNGVPPTLTVDTSDGNGDADNSVVSFASSRSCFPSLSSTPALKTQHSGHSLPPIPLASPDGDGAIKSAVLPGTTALARHQMKHFMRKHMSTTTPKSAVTPKNQ